MNTLPGRWIAGLALIGSCWLSGALAQEAQKDALLAVVEETPITFFDVSRTTGFRERLELQRIVNTMTDENREEIFEAVKSHRAESLERLIDVEVVFEEFKRQGFRLPDEYVMRRIDRRVAVEAGGDWERYEAMLRDAGLTLEEVKDEVRKALAVDVYLAQQVDRKIHLAPADVYAHYQQNQKRYRKPAEVRLQMIAIAQQGRTDREIQSRIDKVAAGLQEGTDFLDLAQTYSDSPGKDVADNFDWLPVGDIQPAFREQFETVRQDAIAGPFQFNNSTVFLRIADVRGGTVPPFEEVREQVRNELFSIERAQRYAIVLDNLRRQTFVRRLSED